MRIATGPSSAASLATPAPSRSASTSRAPSPASRRAHAAPMPRAAPVTNTVRPVSDIITPPRVFTGTGSPSWLRHARPGGDAGRHGGDGHGRARDDEGGGEARLEAAAPQGREDLRDGGNA